MVDYSLQEYYRARASEYEQIYYRDHPARRAEIAAEAGRLSELAADRQVLELACGSGYWTEVMSRTAAGIVASDLSPEMLTEAKKKEFGCDVSFILANMFEHSYGERCFDLVALGFWLSHQPQQEYDRLFEVLLSPLKRDGLIWMVDNNPPAEGSAHPSMGSDPEGNHLQKRKLPNGQEFVILKNYFSAHDLRELLSPYFDIQSLVYNPYYWSVVLTNKA